MAKQNILTCERVIKTAKPILFNAEMVRAIQGGTKTVTRRVLKNQDPERAFDYDYVNDTDGIAREVDLICDIGNNVLEAMVNKIPYFVGDILYVRETWKRFCGMLYGWENGTYIPLDDFEGYQYKSDEQCIYTKWVNPLCDDFEDQKRDINFDDKWHPSIHMPKEAARIFLRVAGVRAERLQDITEKQAIAEGIRIGMGGEPYFSCRDAYAPLWNSTVKKSDLDKYGWSANPWVWVIEFERMEVTE